MLKNMKSKSRMKLLALAMTVGVSGCQTESQMKKNISKVLKENPDVIISSLETDPEAFLNFLNKLSQKAKKIQTAKRQREEELRIEKFLKSPMSPKISSAHASLGVEGAPITIVEYSDFECGFCSRSSGVIKSLMDTYKGKIKFVYKHLPLSFHPNAKLAAQYFEAIRMIDEKKAFDFHDKIFENQRVLKQGKRGLRRLAQELSLNVKIIEKNLNNKKILDRIAQDVAEAEKFGFSGTPGFLLNGIPINGAYPLSHFEKIIGLLKKEGKIAI